ncbi:MAG: oxidoreductase [Chloroflexi bacterium RBG_13_60_9]|nr:MAG: oxidoreductase [Chloroflexi bacterium RBG_13_60_9]
MPAPCKTTVAVFKFSSCDGCQLQILNMEDELLALATEVEIANFLEARRRVLPGPYDVVLVEGSVSTPHEAELIKEIRGQAKLLIAIGACATAGGIQALRNRADVDEFARAVYPHPEFLHYLPKASPISELVPVDMELYGCPVSRAEVLEAITALLHNRKPNLPQHSVCLECKRKGTVCVMVAKNMLCLGPATRSGCGALCPSCGRGCYGCFGPQPGMDLNTLVPTLRAMETDPREAARLLSHVSGFAPAFAKAAGEILAEEKKK